MRFARRPGLFGLAGLLSLEGRLELGVQPIEVSLGVRLEVGGLIQLRVGFFKGLDPLLARRLQECLFIGEGVPDLANAVELGALTGQETHPELEPVGEFGEVLGPHQHVDETDVSALVHRGGALLKPPLSLAEILLGDLEILIRRRYLPVKLAEFKDRIAVRFVRRSRIYS